MKVQEGGTYIYKNNYVIVKNKGIIKSLCRDMLGKDKLFYNFMLKRLV